ncbi:hypothetical protein GCM10025880_39920 [Methylorubrum aminovorans]|nr:hypothetical protein GCM10025880_39920 [Methylorubrum aminovorans]
MSVRPGPAVVCIPARNEAERLPRLLRALAAQDGFSADAPLRVVIVVNNCTDGTVEAVRALEGSGALSTLALRLIEATFPAAEAHVGTARRRALDVGAAWLESEDAPDGVLLTTDADARLAQGWVAANLRALEGAEIVGGRLVIDDEGNADPALAAFHARVERYWSGVRALEDALDPPPHDPAPRHGDHTGEASRCAPRSTARWAACRPCRAARTMPWSVPCSGRAGACVTAPMWRCSFPPAQPAGRRAAWRPRCCAVPASCARARPIVCR